MTISVSCPQCGKQYRVGPGLAGKRAKCQQCGGAIVVPASEERLAIEELLVEVADESPTSTASGNVVPGGYAGEGPTDQQFRLGAAVTVPVILLGMAAVWFGMPRDQLSTAALVVIGLGPFAVCFGILGMISPPVLRSATKFGKHAPRRYKAIAGVVGAAALACSLALTMSLLSY